MKVLVYSAKDFEIPYLEAANKNRHQLTFTQESLSSSNAMNSVGYDAVSIFSADLTHKNISELDDSSSLIISYGKDLYGSSWAKTNRPSSLAQHNSSDNRMMSSITMPCFNLDVILIAQVLLYYFFNLYSKALMYAINDLIIVYWPHHSQFYKYHKDTFYRTCRTYSIVADWWWRHMPWIF